MGLPPVYCAYKRIMKTYFMAKQNTVGYPTSKLLREYEESIVKEGKSHIKTKKLSAEYDRAVKLDGEIKLQYKLAAKNYKQLIGYHLQNSKITRIRNVVDNPYPRVTRFYDKPDFKFWTLRVYLPIFF